MSKKALKQYFKKLHLSEVSWQIKADDETVHPFTNLNVIDALKNFKDEEANIILSNLQSLNGDRVKINHMLKSIAKSFCDNRIEVIKNLFKDFKNAKTDEQKKHFKDIIDFFSNEDLEKAGIGFWRKKNHNWQLTPTWNQK